MCTQYRGCVTRVRNTHGNTLTKHAPRSLGTYGASECGNIVHCLLNRLHRTLETVKDDGEALALVCRHPMREAPVDSCELVMRVDADDRCRACLDAQFAATTEVAARKAVLQGL